MNKDNKVCKERYFRVGEFLRTCSPYTRSTLNREKKKETMVYDVQGIKVTFQGPMIPEYINGYDGMSFVWFLLWALKEKDWIEEILVYNKSSLSSRGIVVKLYSRKVLSIWRRLKITEPWRLIKDHFRKMDISVRYDIVPGLKDNYAVVSRDFVIRPSEEDPNINVVFMKMNKELKEE